MARIRQLMEAGNDDFFLVDCSAPISESRHGLTLNEGEKRPSIILFFLNAGWHDHCSRTLAPWYLSPERAGRTSLRENQWTELSERK